MPKAKVILFKYSGKYYTQEEWEIPDGAIGPYDMDESINFRRIGNGAVYVEAQEPWGYPHLFPNAEQYTTEEPMGCKCEGGCERDAEPHKKLCRECLRSGCHPVGKDQRFKNGEI